MPADLGELGGCRELFVRSLGCVVGRVGLVGGPSPRHDLEAWLPEPWKKVGET